MIGLLDHGLGGEQGMTDDEIRQVGTVESHRPHQEGLFLGADPQRHPAIVFDGSSRHYSSPTYSVHIQIVQSEPRPNANINVIYTNSPLHLPRWSANLNPMIASKGHASVTLALPSEVACVFSSGQVPKLRPIIITVVVPSPA